MGCCSGGDGLGSSCRLAHAYPSDGVALARTQQTEAEADGMSSHNHLSSWVTGSPGIDSAGPWNDERDFPLLVSDKGRGVKEDLGHPPQPSPRTQASPRQDWIVPRPPARLSPVGSPSMPRGCANAGVMYWWFEWHRHSDPHY